MSGVTGDVPRPDDSMARRAGFTPLREKLGMDRDRSLGEQFMSLGAGQSMRSKLVGGQAGQSMGHALMGLVPGSTTVADVPGAFNKALSYILPQR